MKKISRSQKLAQLSRYTGSEWKKLSNKQKLSQVDSAVRGFAPGHLNLIKTYFDDLKSQLDDNDNEASLRAFRIFFDRTLKAVEGSTFMLESSPPYARDKLSAEKKCLRYWWQTLTYFEPEVFHGSLTARATTWQALLTAISNQCACLAAKDYASAKEVATMAWTRSNGAAEVLGIETRLVLDPQMPGDRQ